MTVPSETSPASSLTSECATPSSAGLDNSHLGPAVNLPPPPPLLMQPVNSSSLNSSHDLGGPHSQGPHHGDPYGDHQTPSPYNNFWGAAAAGSMGVGSPSSATSLNLQVKAANVSPPGGSPQGLGVPPTSASAAAAAAAAAASHTTAAMTHQSYHPTYHHNPYYPGAMDFAYLGGQQFNMVNSAAMYARSDAYDAYQQATSEACRYQPL